MPIKNCELNELEPYRYSNNMYSASSVGREEGQSAQDTEGMQTMRTLANNMAEMLQKYATGTAQVAVNESWAPMSFIR